MGNALDRAIRIHHPAGQVASAVRRLPERERYAMEARYPTDGRMGVTLRDLAAALGTTVPMARAAEQSALSMLRGMLDPDERLHGRRREAAARRSRANSGHAGRHGK